MDYKIISIDAPDYTPLINSAAKTHRVDPELIRAVMLQESGGDPGAVGAETKWGRAKGLMQIMPEHVKRLGVKDPHSPKQSINAGAKLLREALDWAGGDQELALKAYFGGTNKANWGEKTEAYPRMVLGRMQAPPKPQAAPGEEAAAVMGEAEPQAEPAYQILGIEVPGAGPTADSAETAAAPPLDLASDTAVGQRPRRFAARAKPVAPLGRPNWTGSAAFSNGMLLGFAPEAAGTMAAAKQFFADPNKVNLPRDDSGNLLSPGEVYSNTKNQLQADRKDFQKDNPWTSLGLELAGSVVPSTAVMGALGRGAVAVGGALARAVPGMAPAIAGAGRVAQGTAGLTATGRAVPGIGAVAAQYGGAVARGAGQGAVGSAITAGLSDEPLVDQIGTGALVGGGLGLLGAGVRGAYNAMRGDMVDPARAALAAVGEKYGLVPRAAQVSGSSFTDAVDKAANALPFTGRAAVLKDQLGKFTKATANLLGVPEGKLNQTTYAAAINRLKQGFDKFANSTDEINLRNMPIETIREVDALMKGMAKGERKLVAGLQREITDRLMSGQPISGKDFQMMTNYGSPLGAAARSRDPNVKLAAGKLRAGLFDALENSVGPEKAAVVRDLRNKWQIGLALKELAKKAGPDGIIDPTALMAQASKIDKNLMVTGGGELGDLARYGQTFFEPGGMPKDAGSKFVKGALGLGTAAWGGGMLGVPMGGLPGAVGLAAATRVMSEINRAGAPGLIREALSGTPTATSRLLSGVQDRAPSLTAQTLNMLKDY